jgi:tetratricopeptide (TPR) repeat protein
VAHPHGRNGRGHPLKIPLPLRRGVVFAAALAAIVDAAPTRPLPPVVGRFAEAWRKIEIRPGDAIPALDAFAEDNSWAADLAAYGKGRALLAKDLEDGRRVLDSLGTAWPGTELGRRAHVAMVRSWVSSPEIADVSNIPLLDRFLGMRLPPELRRTVQMRRLRLQVLNGDTAAVASALADIAGESAPAGTLNELQGIADKFAPALLLREAVRKALAGARFAADQPDSAKALFDSLVVGGFALGSNDRITMGRILLDLGRINEAIASFRLAAEDARSDDALLWLGRGLERVGRVDDAQTVFLEYAKRWPGSAKGQEILWGKGMDAEKAGNCVEAAGWFQKVRLGEGRRAEWAKFREGYCWYRKREWEKARELLDRERLQTKGTMREASWFFTAVANAAIGDTLRADSLFRELARIAPWSFHGHLARERLGLSQAMRDSLAKEPDSVAGKPVPLAWAADVPPSLMRSDSIAFLRALLARTTGEESLWKAELEAMDRNARGAGQRELGLILWMKTLGMEDQAVPRVRRLLSRMTPEEMSRAPKSLLRMFYPMHFLQDMKPHLRGDSIIDAGFVHAVMRQESGFDPWARSPAGAVGLLQLIPPTAKAMASKVGLKGFNPNQLTNPSVNLRLGIAYMRDLERMWNGTPALILANYNAGPAPTLRWREAFRTHPLEEAAEEITYWETRDYVKKCLANWWTYQLLYPEMR